MIRSLISRCGTVCKFASSSLLSFVLDYCLFLLFSMAAGSWAWGLLFSNIAARLISACFNYALNKYMVFHGGGRAARDLPQYMLLDAGILGRQQRAAPRPDRPEPAGTGRQADHRDDAVCGQLFCPDAGDLPKKETGERGGIHPCPRIRNRLPPP